MATTRLPRLNINDVTITPTKEGDSLLLLDEKLIKEKFKARGVILFRGFDFDVDTFDIFTQRFCASSVHNQSKGRDTIKASANIQTVNLGTVPFALHPELARVPWKPDVCFFACGNPPSNGGETTICDGVQIVDKMPSKLLRRISSQRLLYKKPISPSALVGWFGTSNPSASLLKSPPHYSPFSFSVENNRIVSLFTPPFLHKPMFINRLAFGSFLLFSRYTLNQRTFPTFADGSPVDDAITEQIKNISDKLTLAIKWQKGDVLMLDNTRFLHGRNEINDENERLILSKFAYLNFSRHDSNTPADTPWRAKENIDFMKSMDVLLQN
jgi:hypothetical protein